MGIPDISEQLILWATLLGAVAALPALIEFLIDYRKRSQRIALSIEDIEVDSLVVRLAGLDSLLTNIADLIDRARDPSVYSSLRVGNELLIIGPTLSGKKTVARRIAQLASMDRLITVYNARNADALVRAKDLITKYRKYKVMLLIPRVDLVFEDEDQEVLTELDALIETCSEMSNVLVIGTAVYFEPDDAIDNLFGIKVVLPGTPGEVGQERDHKSEGVARMLTEVIDFYLKDAMQAGYQLTDVALAEATEIILRAANNPAEVEDIVVLCQTAALYEARAARRRERLVTRGIIERSIQRVTVNLISRKSVAERSNKQPRD